jgi:hypothetical protein
MQAGRSLTERLADEVVAGAVDGERQQPACPEQLAGAATSEQQSDH